MSCKKDGGTTQRPTGSFVIYQYQDDGSKTPLKEISVNNTAYMTTDENGENGAQGEKGEKGETGAQGEKIRSRFPAQRSRLRLLPEPRPFRFRLRTQETAFPGG